MTVQKTAFFAGFAFVLVAIAGFFAAGLSMDPFPATAPRAFNLFPVNLPHNAVHLLFGIAGIVVARSWNPARWYCRLGGGAYLLLGAIAITTPTLFGLMPIGGPVVGLHLALGAWLAYAGFAGPDARAPTAHSGVAPR